jgi:hypothetical protein
MDDYAKLLLFIDKVHAERLTIDTFMPLSWLNYGLAANLRLSVL